MIARVTITMSKELKDNIEKKREDLCLSRSELFRKAMESYLGINEESEKLAMQKYGPIYEVLQEENKKLSKEVMAKAKKSLPAD